MRRHRFFLNQDLLQNQLVVLDKELSHHITRVLRLTVGHLIYLFNNSDREFSATIQKIAQNKVTIFITKETLTQTQSPCQINLGQVLGKGEKMDLVVQKATELGVYSITPLFSEFAVVKNVADRLANKLEHWQRIAIASCAQSWRNTLPIIHQGQNLSDWISQSSDPTKLLITPHLEAQRLREIKVTSPVSVLIGPEGGFSAPEIEHAHEHGFTAVSLGPRILRTETAGLATIAILQAQHGDL